jgi:hypothetical protein
MGPICLSLLRCDKRTLWQWLPQFSFLVSPFHLYEISLSLLDWSSVFPRLCLSLCAHQWFHYHCCSYYCQQSNSLVILLMQLLLLVWLLLQVMRKSSFFSCCKMRCNAMWMGYFPCADLFITISFCIYIFGNFFLVIFT